MARTTVPNELVAVNAIQGTLIADNAVTAVHIATNAVSGTLIADNAVTSTHIAENHITGTQIAQNTITVTHLADSAVENAKLGADAVTGAKLADNAVDSEHYTDGSIDTAHIGDLQVTAAKIGANAVTLAKMASLTRGSILIGNSAADVTALGVGSANQLLTSDGTDVSWSALNSGIDDNSNAIAMTIDSSENVGIGTTSPTFTNTSFKGIEVEVSGDLFPNVRLERVSGSSKTNQAYEMVIGSGGNWHVRNATQGTAPLSIAIDDAVTMGGTLGVTGNATFTALVGINKAVNAAVGLSVGSDASSSTSYGLEVCNSSSATRFIVDGLGSQRFYGSDNSETARFTDGKLGIGDTDPDNKLDVDFDITGEGSNEGGIKIQNSHGVNNDFAPLYFGVHGGTRRTKAAIGLKRTGSYGIGDLVFAMDANGDDANVTFANDEVMRITSAGNVGIGTTSPTEKLQVNGAIRSTNNATTTLADSGNFYYIPTADDGSNPRTVISGVGTSVGAHIAFHTGTSSSNTEKMRIDKDGKVGIGCVPGQLLTVEGSAPQIELRNTANSYHYLSFVNSSATSSYNDIAAVGAEIDAGSAKGRLVFKTRGTDASGAQTERMRIDSTGDIRFGIANAGLTAGEVYTFDNQMKGNTIAIRTQGGTGMYSIDMQNTTGGSCNMVLFRGGGSASTCGTITATGNNAVQYNTSSDYRLKENVNYSWDATTRLKQLKPAQFNWITDETNTPVDGFIAHEVTSIVPQAVSGEKDAVFSAEDETKGMGIAGDPIYQGIDQAKLVPLLVKTVQELEARIKTLEDA